MPQAWQAARNSSPRIPSNHAGPAAPVAVHALPAHLRPKSAAPKPSISEAPPRGCGFGSSAPRTCLKEKRAPLAQKRSNLSLAGSKVGTPKEPASTEARIPPNLPPPSAAGTSATATQQPSSVPPWRRQPSAAPSTSRQEETRARESPSRAAASQAAPLSLPLKNDVVRRAPVLHRQRVRPVRGRAGAAQPAVQVAGVRRLPLAL